MHVNKIHFWNFNAPEIPEAKHDASAEAIIASALVELSGYVDLCWQKLIRTLPKYKSVRFLRLNILSIPKSMSLLLMLTFIPSKRYYATTHLNKQFC